MVIKGKGLVRYLT